MTVRAVERSRYFAREMRTSIRAALSAWGALAHPDAEAAARISRPVFLVGCGRSGTTILGRAFSHHPELSYLNEPVWLWLAAFPEGDVWSPFARRRGGRIWMDETDCTEERARLARRLFVRSLGGKRRICEKWPINCFRLRLIERLFPDAIFVHIVRNGADVASSIDAALEREGTWFGIGGYKWQALVAFAERQARYRGLAALCENNFHRGLLEWRLSVEAARECLAEIPADRAIELRYEDLVRDGAAVMRDIQRRCGLEPSDAVDAFVRHEVARKTPPAARRLDDRAAAIGGGTLKELLS